MSDLAYLEHGHAQAGEPRRERDAAAGKRARTDALGPRRAEAGKVAAEHIAHGSRDENKLTNEVFWWLEPALRDVKLTAGTDAAAEWLQVRDEVVRPALAGNGGGGHAREITGGELAHHAETAAPPNAVVGPSGDPSIDRLLAQVPPRGSTNQIEATWLLEALGTKLFGAFDSTIGQLTQLSRGETLLRTSDGVSGRDAIERGVAELERQKIHTQHVGAKGGRMQYEVDGGHLPILAVMIDLAAGRLREFVRGGMKDRRVLFRFGDMVRADVDYANAGKHSAHTSGNAIDLGMNLRSEADVVSVLSALPPGKISQVFPDGGVGNIPEHVHLALGDDGLYELGISFTPQFFQVSDSIFSRQKAAQDAAGGAAAEVGKVIHAEGLVQWHPAWYRSTGTHLGGGKWDWKRAYKGPARPHLASSKLKALLDTLDSGKKRDVSVHAAKEDGVDPRKIEH